MSVIKVIKIGLPVATATSAAIATTSLVSFSKKDKLSTEEDLDKSIDDLKLPDEKYQDEKLFYSKDGTGKNQKVLDPETAERLAKLLKEKGSLDDVGAPTPDAKPPINLDSEKSTDSGHKPSDVSSISGQEEKGLTPMSSDENDANEPKDKELQTQADLSAQADAPRNDVKGKDAGDESINKVQLPIEGAEQTDEPSQTEDLSGKDPKQNALIESEEGKAETPEETSSRKNEDQGDLDSGSENSDLGGNDAKKEPDMGASGEENQEQGMQVVQQSQNQEGLNEEGKKTDGEAGSPQVPEAKGDDESSSAQNQQANGTDVNGSREKLTEEDIKKWSSVEAEISSVVGELQALINI